MCTNVSAFAEGMKTHRPACTFAFHLCPLTVLHQAAEAHIMTVAGFSFREISDIFPTFFVDFSIYCGATRQLIVAVRLLLVTPLSSLFSRSERGDLPLR